MATELGSAYISVGLGTNTLTGDIKKAFGSAEGSGKAAGAQAGRGFTSGFKGLVGAGAALVATGAFAGFIAEAARASDATDKFKATMSFAGLNTKAIDTATKAAKAYADQTVYDLPTIQNTLAQLASNGVKDYTGLTKAAGNLNAVAGGNADTFKSVAMVMTQTAGAGKLTTENWNQLADAIPGAAGPLMKALEGAGAYTGNFRDAMAKGQITSEEFNAALGKLGNDPVAVEAAKSTKTFEGAIGNLEATINSGLMTALDAMKPAITGAINLLSGGLGKAFDFVEKAASGLFDLFAKGDFTSSLREAFKVEEDSAFVDVLFRIRDASREVVGGFRAFGAAWKANNGDVTSDGFAGVMERIANGLREGVGGVRAFFAAFKAGGDDITSSGFAGFLEGVGLQARKVFDSVGPSISALLPQIVSLWSAFSPLQIIFKAIQPLLPQLGSMFGQLAAVLGGSLLQIITTLTPMFVQLSGVVSQALGGVIAAVLPTVITMITMLGATMSQLIPIIVPIIGTLVQLATTLISQLMPIITNLVSAILPPLISIFGNILSAIGPVIQMVAGLLIPIIQALMPVVVTVFGVIADVIKNAMQIVQGIIQVVTGIISGNWDQVWSGIGNIFGGIWKTIVALVGGAIKIVWSVIQSGLGLAAGFVGSILGNIGKFFADTWNNVTRGISSFVGGIGKFFGDIPGNIMKALSGAGTWLFDAGKNIVEGLFNGIKSLAGTIGNFFLSLLPGWIVEPFKIALGIHSPSRVFKGFGQNIGQGLLDGVDGMQGRIDGTMSNLVTVPPVPRFGSPAYASALPGAGSLGATNNFTINQVDDPIGTAHAIARRQLAVSV